MKMTGNAASDPSGSFPDQDHCFLECTFVQTKDQFDNPLKSKEKGYPFWTLELTVTEGDSKGRKMWHNIYFIPPGLPGHGMALKCLHAFGLPHEGEIDLADDGSDFYQRVAEAKVGHEEYKGKVKNIIARWYTPEETSEGQQEQQSQQETEQPTETPAAAQPAADKLRAAGFGVKSATVNKPVPAPTQTKKAPLWGGRKK